MGFLLVVIGVLAHESSGSLHTLQRDDWFYKLLDKFAVTPLALAVVIALMVLAVALVLGWLAGAAWWLYLGAELLILLYSFGRGDLARHVDDLAGDLSAENVQAAFHEVENYASSAASEAENWQQFRDDLMRYLPYQYLDRHYAVIFLFALGGGPLALLYRLLRLAQARPLTAELKQPLDFTVWLLEWIPVRMLGLLCALVGDFVATRAHLSELFFSGKAGSAEALRSFTCGALSIPPANEGATRFGAEVLPAVRQLYARIMTMALALLALVVLLMP